MKRWKDITVFQFQELDRINSQKKVDDLDKLLFSVCAVYGMTETQLDAKGAIAAGKLINEITKLMLALPSYCACKWMGRYKVNYDPASMTFGQYVELSFFLQNRIEHAHRIMASITNTWHGKNRGKDHRSKSEYFRNCPLEKVMGCVLLFEEHFRAFNKQYSALFGRDQDGPTGDLFNKRYGWVFSATQVAEHERISLEAAFALPIRQALGDMVYLKAKNSYMESLKKKPNGR